MKRKTRVKEVHYFTGVYSIMHIASRKRYIGSTTKTFGERLRQHRIDLRRGGHASAHLQNAWNKYGEKAFRFRVMKRCEPDQVLQWEQHFIDHYKTIERRCGYNSNPLAGRSAGFRWSAEQRARLSIIRKGHVVSAETRKKIADAHRGRPKSPEHIAKIAHSRSNSPIVYAMLCARNKSAKMRALTVARNKDPLFIALRVAARWPQHEKKN